MWAVEAAGDFLAYNEVVNNPITKGVQLALGGVGLGGFAGWLASKRIKKKIKQRATILSRSMPGKRLRGSDVPIVTPSKPERISYNRQENGDFYAGGGPVEIMPGGSPMEVAGGGPAKAPTVKTQKREYKLQVADTFGPANYVKIIGDPDLVAEHGVVRFPSMNGWGFNQKHYFDVRRYFTPFRLSIGDVLSTKATNTTAPTNIVAGTSGTMSANYNRWYNSDWTTVAKSKATDSACLKVSGGYINEYCDFCIPLMPNCAYGEPQIGGSVDKNDTLPLGCLDFFGDMATGSTTTGGILDTYMYQIGAYPFAMKYGSSAPATLLGEHNYQTDYDPRECYVNGQFEVRLYNPGTKAMTFELIQCKPRKVTRTSPIYDLQLEHENLVTTSGSYDDESSSWKYIGADLNKYKVFKTLWKITRRRVKVVPGSVVAVKLGLRTSLMKRAVLKNLLEGNTFTSLPGITQWLWIRASGPFGGDANTGMIGNEKPEYWVQLFERCSIVAGIPMVPKTIDARRTIYNGTITVDELVAQDDQGKE